MQSVAQILFLASSHARDKLKLNKNHDLLWPELPELDSFNNF